MIGIGSAIRDRYRAIRPTTPSASATPTAPGCQVTLLTNSDGVDGLEELADEIFDVATAAR